MTTASPALTLVPEPVTTAPPPLPSAGSATPESLPAPLPLPLPGEARWPALLASYLETLSSPATVRTYRRAIVACLETLGAERISALTPADLTRYRAGLVARLTTPEEAARLTPASVALALAAVRAFLRFCRLTGATALGQEVLAVCLNAPRATVQTPYAVLSEAEQRRLLEAARAAGNARDVALLSLLLATGLRVAEACAVRVGDLWADDDGDLWLHVRLGKGRKDRHVPLSAAVAGELAAYLAGTGRSLGARADRATPLFRSREGGGQPLTTTRAYQLVRAYAASAQITAKAITPHSLRHTYAIGQLRAGASPIVVQKLLGHASVGTTQKYLDHLERDELKQWARTPPGPVPASPAPLPSLR